MKDPFQPHSLNAPAMSAYSLGVITDFELNRDYIAEVLCIDRKKPITMLHESASEM